MQARDTLTVTFTDRSQKFQSFIVNLDSNKGAIWIDELIPREGDRYANQGESFRIDAWHEGIHMRWNCPGASQVMLDDAPAYAIPLPAELIYHQKRGAFEPVCAAPLTLQWKWSTRNGTGALPAT